MRTLLHRAVLCILVSLTLLLTSGLSRPASTSAAAELLLNGDFEAGNTNEWAVSSGSIAVTAPAHAGAYAMAITGTATVTQSLDSGLRPTTIVDYLYRLRKRSNYEDPTMFTDGPEDPSDSRRVHRNLCNITGATLLAHELHVGKLIGQSHLASLVDEWLGGSAVADSNPSAATNLQDSFCMVAEGRPGGGLRRVREGPVSVGRLASV